MYDCTIRHESALAVRFVTSVTLRVLVGLALIAPLPIATAAVVDDSDSAPATALHVEPDPTFALLPQTREVSPLAHARPLLASPVADTKSSVQVQASLGQPVLTFDATDLDFGTVAVGDSSGWKVTMLTNTGSGDATALQFTTDPAFPFLSLPGWDPCYGGWTALEPGGTCMTALKFAPSSSGQANGTLSVSSAEGARASLDLTGAGSEESVLYGQFHDWTIQPIFGGLLNSHFLSTPTHDSELADDFEVEAGRDWMVSAVGAEVMYMRLHPPQPLADIYFMPDADGVPGDTPVCAAPDSQITLWETPYDESRAVFQLSSPCTLAPGHYWLRIILTVAERADSFYWGLQFVENPDDAPPVHLHPPVWRNPEGGTDYPGCFEWTPVVPANCSLEEVNRTFYGSVFWIIGQETVIDPIFANGFEVPQ